MTDEKLSTPPVNQMAIPFCQLCGQDMQCSQYSEVNYQKQVDPPANNYSQLIPDYHYELDEERNRKKEVTTKSRNVVPLQVCMPIPVVYAESESKSMTPEKGEPSNLSPPAKPVNSETKKLDNTKSLTSSATAKATCFPTGGAPCPPPVKMMLCLPCPPPNGVVNSGASGSTHQPCPKGKPVDYTYRCESRELRGGNLYQCCQCNKRNGLQHDCPRTPCQGRPACLTKPWPDCWPSGGCHGIDYSREKGTKRIDPCREQRFDKKECRPPGSSKADCGGNMMLVVCPPPPPS